MFHLCDKNKLYTFEIKRMGINQPLQSSRQKMYTIIVLSSKIEIDEHATRQQESIQTSDALTHNWPPSFDCQKNYCIYQDCACQLFN